MADGSSGTVQLQNLVERLRSGDRSVLDELVRHACGRLQKLAHQMLRDYPGVRRWAQTDDVLQGALVRLLRALQAVQPASVREFFSLATEQIRRELLDLARHHFGPEGPGARHATEPGDDESRPPLHDRPDLTHEPGGLAEWCEVHRHIRELPEDEREVVGLLFYQGLTQTAAAEVLHVTVRTVQRRWQSALLKLHRILKGQWPGT